MVADIQMNVYSGFITLSVLVEAEDSNEATSVMEEAASLLQNEITDIGVWIKSSSAPPVVRVRYELLSNCKLQ